VLDTDTFVFNDKFTSKLYKVKISTVAAGKEGETEKAETRHKVTQPLYETGAGIPLDRLSQEQQQQQQQQQQQSSQAEPAPQGKLKKRIRIPRASRGVTGRGDFVIPHFRWRRTASRRSRQPSCAP